MDVWTYTVGTYTNIVFHLCRFIRFPTEAGENSSYRHSATKYAVESLSDALRIELHPWKVSVSIINLAFVRTEIFTKFDNMRGEANKEANPEHVKLYENILGEETTKKSDAMIAKADDAQVTTDAITHAICDPHPDIRYIVANVDGTPAWVLIWMKWFLPERLFDAIVIATLY